jgi:hypothetical protein
MRLQHPIRYEDLAGHIAMLQKLHLNVNPALRPHPGWLEAVEAAGTPYEIFVGGICATQYVGVQSALGQRRFDFLLLMAVAWHGHHLQLLQSKGAGHCRIHRCDPRPLSFLKQSQTGGEE